MRNEYEWLEPGRAGIGRHRSRCITRRDARHAPHPQPARLGYAAGHSVVFEGSRGIKSLVLEHQRVKPAISSRMGS